MPCTHRAKVKKLSLSPLSLLHLLWETKASTSVWPSTVSAHVYVCACVGVWFFFSFLLEWRVRNGQMDGINKSSPMAQHFALSVKVFRAPMMAVTTHILRFHARKRNVNTYWTLERLLITIPVITCATIWWRMWVNKGYCFHEAPL